MKPEWKTFWYWLTQFHLEMADKTAFTNYKKHIPSSGKLGTSSSNKSCKIDSTTNNISFSANGKYISFKLNQIRSSLHISQPVAKSYILYIGALVAVW